MAAKTAGTDTIDTNDTTLFDASDSGCGPCLRWCIVTDAACLVSVSGLHKAGEYFPLAAGESITFRGRISKVIAKSAVGNATVRHGVVAA